MLKDSELIRRLDAVEKRVKDLERKVAAPAAKPAVAKKAAPPKKAGAGGKA